MRTNIIFVKVDKKEKRAISSAAKSKGISLGRFGLEAITKAAGIPLEDETCKNCVKRLSASNRSGFCRNCLRTLGIEALKKLHAAA
jgi:uncharacterized protein (DUF1778 family)